MSKSRLFQIESDNLWPDFHAKFLNYWQESLADALPGSYEARIGEQVCLFSSDGVARRFGPDISVIRSSSAGYVVRPTDNEATTVTLDHVSIEEEIRTTHIEIIHRPQRRLVTILELLSPSNKSEPGRSRYLTKRAELLLQPVHLVELDLLMGGQRLPHQQTLPEADYYSFLSRVEDRFRCSVTAWRDNLALPTIAIPLLAPDKDIQSPLQSVLDIAYAKGRYAP